MDTFANQIIAVASDEFVLRRLLVWLSAASAFVLVIGGALITLGVADPLRGRVGSLTSNATKKKSSALLKAATSLGPVAAFVLPQDELERNKVMMQLYHAGYRSSTALQLFYFVKTLLIIMLPLGVLVASRFIPAMEPRDIITYALVAAAIGMFGTNFVLHYVVRKRKRALSNGFPDALDLLVVCVESGLGLSAAIQRVADELSVSHPELASELALVNAEIRVGVQREQALRNFSDRTGLEDIRGLVGLLVQTMRFGTGVADALRVYSEEFRDKRTQKAEELAAKMGTKLVFPLIFFMFPLFFIVAVGPAVLRIIEAFSKM